MKLFIILVIIPFLLFPIVNAQEIETRTFEDCYRDTTVSIFMASMFSPISVDLNDPEFKQFITNACNFFHEKTGLWMDIAKDDPGPEITKDPKIFQEFTERYGSTMPKSLNDLWNYQIKLNQTK